jgi:hypothetical protein
MQATRHVDLPWTCKFVGESKTNIFAFVVSKIQVIAAKWFFYPIWYPYKGWTLNVVAD